jgi:hypothetical protein
VTLAGQALIQFLIANTPGAALGCGKKFVDRFMAGKPKIVPRSRSAKIPPVSITRRRRGQTFYDPSQKLEEGQIWLDLAPKSTQHRVPSLIPNQNPNIRCALSNWFRC